MLNTLIRKVVRKNPNLKLKLIRANSKKTPFQYVLQTFLLSGLSFFFFLFVILFFFRANIVLFSSLILLLFLFLPLIYIFWFNYVDVHIKRIGNEIDSDLLFVSEFFLVLLESGLPLGNAIERISKIKRPGGIFFRKVFLDFETGKDLEKALENAIENSPSLSLKSLLKKLKDSLEIGVDLRNILKIFIQDSSEKKVIEVKAFAKKLNPLVMFYLLLGIVLPSLGVTFFILGATILNITTTFLNLILFSIFLLMFLFQYLAYSGFRFGKAILL